VFCRLGGELVTYDLVGNKTSETDVNGIVTEFRYDGLYHLEKKVLPVTNPQTSTNYEELYRHDKVGNLRRFTDANGKVTETEYDGLNRVKKVTRDVDGLGLVTTTTYDDPEGSHVNKSEERDVARGLRTTFTYDPLNRELTRTVKLEGEDGDPAPNQGPYATTTAYEDGEHAVRVTDPRGVVTLRKLDGLDRVIEETVDTEGLAPAAPLSLVTTVRYDGLGNKKEVTDPENRTTTFDYDELGRLLKTTDAKQQETRYTYFGDGLKESETDRRGVKKLFSYDNLGRLRKTRLDSSPFSGVAWSHETQYVDALQPKRIEIDARGKKTIFDLDGLGRMVQETDHGGDFRTFTWDGVNKVAETDKRRNKTLFEYDGINRLKKTTDPAPFAGQTVETTYEDALNRVSEKDRRGTRKVTQTDPLGRVLRITEAQGAAEEALVERNTWDANGNRETQKDGEGHVTRFVYDAANRGLSRTDGFGTAVAATTSYVYDKAGNLLEERDARAAELGEPWSVKKTYDELNRVLTSMDGEADVTHFDWDEEGNRRSEETPKGQLTTTLHDELGKPLDVTQPPPKPGEPALLTRFRYDANRNLIRMEDADGRVTKLEYDDLNRLFKTTRDPGALNLVSETTDFDADGRPLRIAEANGEVTRQTWDELGRLGTRTHEPPATGWTAPWQFTSEERYSYDPNSNLERVEEHDSRTGGGTPPVRVTTRGYDRLDRQTSEKVTLQDGSTKSVTTEYWRNGQVKSVTDAQGATSYTYDCQGREEAVTTSAGETRKTYYPDGLVKDITFPNLTKRAHGYDKADRLLSVVTTKDGATVTSTAYTYDPNGNRLTQVQTNGGVEETTYTYDDLDRMATVTYPADAEHQNGRKVTYGHDGAGNRKTEVVTNPQTEVVLESKTGHFDNANRLTELTDNLDAAQTTRLGWDRNGNLLSETKAGVTTSYRYDLRDTLAEVERGGQTLARFLGDFDERRVLKIGDPARPGGSGVQEYVYNGSRLILDVENGQPVSRYEWTNEELVSLLQSGGARRYFALDGLETVLALTDEAGQATDRLNFDAWGVPKAGTDFGTSGSRFAFTSHRFDTELNLYYAGGRMYSPTIGRFISQDTLSLDPNNPDTWNLFSYAHANPTTYVDEDGHSATAIGAALGTAWGVGQAIGGFIDDKIQGKTRSAGEYFSVVAQNAIAGTEIGLAIDIGLGSGGLASAPAGALIGAGLSGLTFQGRAQEWSDFAVNQGKGALIGGAVAAVPQLAVPLAAYGVYTGVQEIRSGAPEVGATSIALSVTPFAFKGVRNAVFGRGRAPAPEPPPTASNGKPVTLAEGSGQGAASTAVRPAIESGPPATSSSTNSGARFIADANGNVRDVSTGRGRLNPIGQQGPFGVDESGVARTGRGIVRQERPGFLEFEGLEVRGARDLSHVPESTLRVMKERGFAGTDPATGDPLIMHHMDQSPSGPLVEMPATRHSVWNARQHPLGNAPGTGLSAEQRAAFNQWRVEYWKARAAEELARRGPQ